MMHDRMMVIATNQDSLAAPEPAASPARAPIGSSSMLVSIRLVELKPATPPFRDRYVPSAMVRGG